MESQLDDAAKELEFDALWEKIVNWCFQHSVTKYGKIIEVNEGNIQEVEDGNEMQTLRIN